MDPISNVDGLVLLLRQRLEARARAGQPGRTPDRQVGDSQPQTGMDTVRALAGLEGVDQRQFKRALIQSLLAERLGAKLINDAKFQHVVDQVVEALESEAGAAGLLESVAKDLQAAAR